MNFLTELKIRFRGMDYVHNWCKQPYDFEFKIEHSSWGDEPYLYIYQRCPRCNVKDNLGSPLDYDVSPTWWRGRILTRRPWPQHKAIVNEILEHASNVWQQCNGCNRALHNGFIREEYSGKRRNYCVHCSYAEPNDIECSSEESCTYWWNYPTARIKRDISTFRQQVLENSAFKPRL